MSRRHKLKINLLASWGKHAVGLLIGLFLMPFVLHTLGDNKYGMWVFINSIVGYSGLLYLGFGETISRYVATCHARKEYGRLNQVVNVVLAVYVCMGAVALVVAGMFAWFAPCLHTWTIASVSEIRLVILILGLNVAIGMVGSVFGGVLMGIQRFDIEGGIAIGSGLLRLILTVCFLRSEWGLLTLALIFLAMNIAEVLAEGVFAFAKVQTLSLRFRHLRWSTFRECFSFSTFAFINSIASKLIYATDAIIIGFVYGAKAIVPFYIALRLCQFITTPIKHIGMVSMPRAGELYANAQSDKLKDLVTKGLGLAFLLTMGFFIGSGFFGRTLIETWVGPGYHESYLLLLVLLGAQIVAVPVGVLRSVLFGIGHVRAPAFMYLAEAIAYVVLTLILIRPLGLMGVALGTAIPILVVELGMLLPYAYRRLYFEPGRLIRAALGPQVLPLTALLVYSFAVTATIPPKTGWILLSTISVGGGAVLGIVWLCSARYGRHLGLWKSVGT